MVEQSVAEGSSVLVGYGVVLVVVVDVVKLHVVLEELVDTPRNGCGRCLVQDPRAETRKEPGQTRHPVDNLEQVQSQF